MKPASLMMLALVMLAPAARAAEPAKAAYHLAKKLPVEGAATYYDYVFLDEPSRRLYVTFGGDVVVFDADTGALVTRLGGHKKVHGVAVAEGRAFVTDGETNLVSAHDATTGKPLGEVKAGANPDAVIYDPASKQLFAFNHTGGTVTIIDPRKLEVGATIDTGGKLEFAQADGKGTVWVNAEDKSEIIRLDSRKRAVTARWKLAPCEAPTGLAFDPKHRRLFAGCDNEKMAVVDADSGKVVTTVPIGPGVDATAFDAKTGDIFNSCGGGDGSLVVVHQDSADKYSVAQTIPTQKRAKTLALDPRTHRVFVTAGTFGPPPAATAENPKPRGAMVPGSFTVMVFER
jgi:DNA-binding beta-propeller fold protein YncE